jgi:ribosomal protein S18 acetylase RimI-like enzyme
MTSHKTKPPTYRYRLATIDDASAVFNLLEEVAPEIPIPDFPKKKHLLDGRVKKGCTACDVWIALDRDDLIVGFLMAEPFGDGLDLSYGGVKKCHRRNGILSDLVAKMKEREVPLRASVALANEKMPDYLQKHGFAIECNLETETMFLWEPEPPAYIPIGHLSPDE